MSVSNVIKAAMNLQHVGRPELAQAMETTPASLSVKFNRDAWSAGDLIRAASCMGLKVALIDSNNEILIKFNESDATPPRRSRASAPDQADKE